MCYLKNFFMRVIINIITLFYFLDDGLKRERTSPEALKSDNGSIIGALVLTSTLDAQIA